MEFKDKVYIASKYAEKGSDSTLAVYNTNSTDVSKEDILEKVKDKVLFSDKIEYAKKSLEGADLSFISNRTDEIVQNVVQKYQQRSNVGIKKYNTTLQENTDGIEVFLTHLQEELMDATLYIEKLKQQVKQLKTLM